MLANILEPFEKKNLLSHYFPSSCDSRQCSQPTAHTSLARTKRGMCMLCDTISFAFTAVSSENKSGTNLLNNNQFK